MPPIKAGEKHLLDEHHEAARLMPLTLERIQATPEGGGRADWPDRLQLDCHRNYTGHSDVYGRLAYNQIASTLTTRCTSYSNGRFGHPTQDRAISVREASRLQTFPKNYKFSGAMGSKAKQIGNAVPPLLAQRFGEVFLNMLENI